MGTQTASEAFFDYAKRFDVWRRRFPYRLWYRVRYPRDLARVLCLNAPRGKDELIALYELGRSASAEGSIVEIGSFHGSSAAALALGSRKGNHPRIYSIDPYEPFAPPDSRRTYGPHDRVFLLRTILSAGVAEDVWLINLPSVAASRAWSGPISLLWIDGDHSYEGAKADFDAWSPFVIPGGLVAFDDTTDKNLGPWRVIDEALQTGQFERHAAHGKIAVLRRQIGTSQHVASAAQMQAT
ncbi:MAG TPA: class I SAM-dependent methyltransferase [Tepidisphaeraceae bacterium]|nr:class I SAM-dependent methyltransferase [Tepidisphaeraceae bacterium]